MARKEEDFEELEYLTEDEVEAMDSLGDVDFSIDVDLD